MNSLIVSLLIWAALGTWGAYIIVKSEVGFDEGYWKNVTFSELFTTLKWVFLGPITLFLIVKWMFEEEDLGNKKVFSEKSDDSNTKI